MAEDSFWSSRYFQLAFTTAMLVAALYLVLTRTNPLQIAGGAVVAAYATFQLYMLLKDES
jgi:hypothetical protein